MKKTIAAAQFKAHGLQLMNDVQEKSVTFPIEKESINLYGALKGTVKIHGDIIAPIDEHWGCDNS